jgi:hypothetical protein
MSAKIAATMQAACNLCASSQLSHLITRSRMGYPKDPQVTYAGPTRGASGSAPSTAANRQARRCRRGNHRDQDLYAACGVRDHNGAVAALLAVCGTTHRESYLDTVMVDIVGAIIALTVVIGLGLAFGSI